MNPSPAALASNSVCSDSATTSCQRTSSTVLEGVKIDSDQPPGLGVQIGSKIERGAVRTGQHEFRKRLVDDLDRPAELAALTRR